MDDYRNSPTIKFCADVFPAHRCPSAIMGEGELIKRPFNFEGLISGK